jgi:hypothetical protein
VVTPLAVATGTSKLTGNTCTIWKRAHTAPYALTTGHRVDHATPLDKDGIDVRGTVGGNLSWRDGASHEGNILTWHGQDRTLLVCVTNRGKLLLSYKQGVRSGGRVVKLKSPTYDVSISGYTRGGY